MQDFRCSCMQMMGYPNQYYQTASLPQQQLENMYPKTYYVIQPAIETTCDKMIHTHGGMYTPTREQLESMIDEVYSQVEVEVEVTVKDSPREEERQFLGGGRRILRDFIGALLIANLIRRRPYYGYGYPYNYGGGYGYYGGYPY